MDSQIQIVQAILYSFTVHSAVFDHDQPDTVGTSIQLVEENFVHSSRCPSGFRNILV
jgi:hypothetical protein